MYSSWTRSNRRLLLGLKITQGLHGLVSVLYRTCGLMVRFLKTRLVFITWSKVFARGRSRSAGLEPFETSCSRIIFVWALPWSRLCSQPLSGRKLFKVNLAHVVGEPKGSSFVKRETAHRNNFTRHNRAIAINISVNSSTECGGG